MKISASKTAAAACIEKIKWWISGCCFCLAVLLKAFLLKLIFRCFFCFLQPAFGHSRLDQP